MKRSTILIVLAAGCTAALPGEASEAAAAILEDATVSLGFRYRYEHVDDDAFENNANASTLRSTLSLASGSYRGASFLVEVEDIREIIADDFDAGFGNTPGRSGFPLVPDPEGTEINQAYVSYRPLTALEVRLGRQRVNLDNQRFVGGVGWRQNEQTYDALSATYEGARARLFYAYVDNVNRVFGEDVPAGDHRQDGTHLVNLTAEVGRFGRLGAYHYAIDNDDAPALSTRTTGARLTGSRELTELTFAHQLEYAWQSDLAGNPASYRAHYWHVSGSATVADLTVSLGWEVLTGDRNDPGEAFRTPFATLHAFNGWADQFLTTPDAGLDDRYLALSFESGPWTFEAAAHRFEAEDGDADFGNEIDLRIGRSLGERIQVDAFAAAFDGDGVFRDVTKLWLMVTARL